MRTKLRFIHITKTGGTSIENEAKDKGIEWGRFDKSINNMKNIPQSWHAVSKLNNKFEYFMVVRNPYDRLISEFHCKFSNPSLNTQKWTNKDFNIYLKRQLDIMKRKVNTRFLAGSLLCGHYIPQYLYFDKTAKIHVLKFENLENDFNNLMKSKGIDVTLSRHDNQSTKKMFSVNDISNENISLINEIYKYDFLQFNYKMKL